ncbi:MAG TPA: phosphotransferase [Anaerolineales bacterium]|nr:phosphotransferase [Anaerolineales bacterium]
MNKKRLALCLIFLLASLFTLPASAAPLYDEEEAIQIRLLINEYRQENGLYQYVYNPVLAATAQAHSEYQASIEESTHYGEGDSRSRDRAELMGYGDGVYIFVSEMIYAGQYATPKAALTWWKNSPIHNGIMLSTDYYEIGVGVARTATHIYYTVNVGAVRGVTSPGVGSGGEVIDPAAEATSAPVATSTSDDQGGIYHTVEEGQTLSGIASAYNVTADDLRVLNGLAENAALTAGRLLLIQQPTESDDTIIIESDQVDPESLEQLPTPTATTQAIAAADTPTPFPTITQAPAVIVPGSGDEDSGQGGTNWLLFGLLGLIALTGLGAAGYFYMQFSQMEKKRAASSSHDRAAFHRLSRQEQLARLTEVAAVALESYPLDVVKIEPMRYVLNAEFLVDARMEGGSGQVEQFVVRVNAPRFNTGVEIASELDWLQALNERTRINVPLPIRKRNGDWVKIVDLPGMDEPRHCVVFRFIPGTTIEMEATPAHLEVMGALIGLLHKHGAQFQLPRGFVRDHWDKEGLKGGNLDVSARQAYDALTEHESQIVDEAEKLLEETMRKIGRSDETYGLIHGDLHLKSILFNEGKPLILDFDTCGYGYYAYDLAVPIWNLFHLEDFASLKAALLKGYRRVRPLSDIEESQLIHFVAGRLMAQILTWAGRRKNSNLAEIADEAIKKQAAQLEKLIDMLVN